MIKMDWEDLFGVFMIVSGILLFVGLLFFGNYELRTLKYNNFQKTIQNLTDEQKCIHICGFQWDSYIENYKFCLEKCDRISERVINKNG